MTPLPSLKTTVGGKAGFLLLLALIVAGLAGNYFRFPVFLNIDFLFGSIFAMLALQFFGLGRGIVATVIIAGYTYTIWNHPYAIIIMTAEVATVGWLLGRRKRGLVLADTIYWLIIGMPLVYFFHYVVMDVSLDNTYIVMTKQAINGITNALVARLIFTGYTLRSRTSLTSYRDIVYNLLAFFVLCPSLIMLAVESRTDFAQMDRHIRSTLVQDSQRINQRLETWVLNRQSAILNLAEMAASRSPLKMQSYLEMAKKSDVSFNTIGLQDREATTTATFPLVDELGQQSVGKNFADRLYIAQLKQTLKPMLSEILMGRIGAPKPIVLMLAPVVVHGEYGGYLFGILRLEQVQEYLDKSVRENTSLYSLLDKNGNVIMTNRKDQKIMAPFARGQGTVKLLDNGISQWVPVVPANTPTSERWKQSVYSIETTIGDPAEWKLILEQPVAPFQKELYGNYTGKLTLLFVCLLGALALAELLSRKIVVSLKQLQTLTHELPNRLDGKNILWPESGINEANHLITNFREMANSLTTKFIELRQVNESLEQRTTELKRLNTELEAFCYAISHEFSAPLARLEAFSRMMTESATIEDNETVAHCAERIEVASQRLRNVVAALLTLNRLSRADMLVSPVNLSEMAQQIVAELLEQDENRRIQITIAPDIVVQGDRYQLEICLRNLLENALKYSSKTDEAAIEFGKLCRDGVETYYVRDNGVGFDMEYAKNLFIPFCRLHSESEFEGTGVGLATVHRIIEKHNGRIWAEAELGRGATFSFTLEIAGGSN